MFYMLHELACSSLASHQENTFFIELTRVDFVEISTLYAIPLLSTAIARCLTWIGLRLQHEVAKHNKQNFYLQFLLFHRNLKFAFIPVT